jgi:hypothetical protein
VAPKTKAGSHLPQMTCATVQTSDEQRS